MLGFSLQDHNLRQPPPIMEVEDREPGVPRQGWQHAAVQLPRMSPLVGRVLGSLFVPVLHSRIDSALFRVLLQRRLHLPLPLSKRICGCGRPLDPFGHHCATCSMTGALGRRVRSGECGRQSLQGSWGQSRDEHVCAGHGLGGACGWRQKALGSGRRRPSNARRSAVSSSCPLFVAVEERRQGATTTVWP